MLTEERFQRIISIVEENGSISVQQLTKELDTSESTIRRDLTVLDKEGMLVKVRGGAIAKGSTYTTSDDTVMHRKACNQEDKATIAKFAAQLIKPDDFIYLDAGTTTEMMIDYINEKNLTFVTNALTHAKKLAEKGYTVYIPGGEYKFATEAIVGEEAIESLSKYNFTKGFWGTNGVNPVNGFTTPDVKEAMLKKKVMENCKKRYVLCDSSKFSQISSVTFAEFDSACIITTHVDNEKYKKYNNILEVNKE